MLSNLDKGWMKESNKWKLQMGIRSINLIKQIMYYKAAWGIMGQEDNQEVNPLLWASHSCGSGGESRSKPAPSCELLAAMWAKRKTKKLLPSCEPVVAMQSRRKTKRPTPACEPEVAMQLWRRYKKPALSHEPDSR